MRPFFVLLCLFTILTSCSPSTESTAPDGIASEPASPEEVARQFFEAGNAADEATFLSLMTEKARAGMSAGDGPGISEAAFESFTVGAATINGDTAEVPVDAVQDGEPQTMNMKMRKEANAWRVFGVGIEAPDGMSMTINFEEIGDMLAGIANGMGEALTAGLGEAFSEMTQGASGKDLEAKKAVFESLAPVSQSEYEAMWKNTIDFRDETTLNAITALADGIGLTIQPREHADALSGPVAIDVAGLPRAEAIEKLCNEVGLHAKFPDPVNDWGLMSDMMSGVADGLASMVETAVPGVTVNAPDSTDADPYAVTLESGNRPLPVQFSGPFVFSIDDITTDAPNPTGTLTFSVRAYGLSPSLMNILATDVSATEVAEAVGPNGEPLIRDDTSYLSGGEPDGAVYADLFGISLYDLLRSVTHIASFSGVQRIAMPTSVQSLALENLAEGQTQTVGEFEVKVESTDGNYTRLQISGPEAGIESLNARFWATAADGADVDIMMENTDTWEEGVAQASVQTYDTHTSLQVKLVAMSEPIQYPFALKDIPVPGHEEMPETIEAMSFEGADAPVSVAFVRFIDDDPNFREVVVSVTNHSNKDANSVFSNFVYLDANGAELDDFPSSLNGEFDADGFGPVAKAGATAEVQTAAFSAPQATASVRIDVERVDFVDGTVWEVEN